MGCSTDEWGGWLIWVWKQSSVEEALSKNSSNTSCKRQEANGFSICRYLRMQACSRDLEMTAHFSFAISQVRYEDNRLITRLYATRQTPDVTLEESQTEIVSCFVCSFGSHCQDLKIKTSGAPVAFYEPFSRYLYTSPLCSDETPFGDSFCGYCLFVFGMSAIWSVCIFFFFSVQHAFYCCNPS